MQNRLRDSELVVMMRGGDKAAFGVLFDRYYDLLHTFARHIVKDSSVAEDIIQNVFVNHDYQTTFLCLLKRHRLYIVEYIYLFDTCSNGICHIAC